MKALKKYRFMTLLVLSVLCNILLCYYLSEANKPSSSIVRFVFNEHNRVIYCEKSREVQSIKINTDKGIYTIGDAKLINEENSLLLVTPEEKINLSDYDGLGFIINSNGELLYSLNIPIKKQQMVYITPSGKKYHTNIYCAGKTGFEISLDTAKLMREPCSLCA